MYIAKTARLIRCNYSQLEITENENVTYKEVIDLLLFLLRVCLKI